MNDIIGFEFEGSPVRVVMQGGEPQWVAKDVCDVLDHSNSRTALERLDDDEKGVSTVYTPGGAQEMAVVTEAGLYTLVLTSRMPKAKEFKRWITHDVIPSIRRNGMYITAALLDDPEHLLQVTARLVEERRARLSAEARLADQAPLVTFAETCLTSKDSILVRELAKVASDQGFIIGEKRLYQRLREWGLIMLGCCEPTQRGMDMGLFEVIERPVETAYGTRLTITTKVTPKGQVYIIERLRSRQARA